MPAVRVSETPVPLRVCDVVGYYRTSTASFVSHVALARDPLPSLVVGVDVAIVEMGPPLRDSHWAADVVGTSELSVDEVLQIKNFCREHVTEHAARDCIRGRGRYKGYVIVPHASALEGGTTRRFSCAGFVIEAYRDAGIDLVDTDPQRLVRVPKDVLSGAFPVVEHPQWEQLNREYKWGLDVGVAEWPVVLPGYVLHALARNVGAIRTRLFVPSRGNELFP